MVLGLDRQQPRFATFALRMRLNCRPTALHPLTLPPQLANLGESVRKDLVIEGFDLRQTSTCGCVGSGISLGRRRQRLESLVAPIQSDIEPGGLLISKNCSVKGLGRVDQDLHRSIEALLRCALCQFSSFAVRGTTGTGRSSTQTRLDRKPC